MAYRARTTPAPYATRDTDLPTREVFAELRDRWRRKFSGTTSADLAARLGVLPQRVSQWITGSDNDKRPPIWAVLAICHDLGLALRIAPNRIEIVRDVSTRQRTSKARASVHGVDVNG